MARLFREKKFNLHSNSTREFRETEEGLATINTVTFRWRSEVEVFIPGGFIILRVRQKCHNELVQLFTELAPYMPSPKGVSGWLLASSAGCGTNRYRAAPGKLRSTSRAPSRF